MYLYNNNYYYWGGSPSLVVSMGTFHIILCIVEPLYCGHHWDCSLKCPHFRDIVCKGCDSRKSPDYRVVLNVLIIEVQLYVSNNQLTYKEMTTIPTETFLFFQHPMYVNTISKSNGIQSIT